MRPMKIRRGATLALIGATVSCSAPSAKERSHATPASAPTIDSMASDVAAPKGLAMTALTAAAAKDRSAENRRQRTAGQDPSPGVLTAAAWDDAAHWPQYTKFLNRARENAWNVWGIELDESTVHQVSHDEPKRAPRRALDMGFLVDATGSMGDEMTYLQSELRDIVGRVRAVEPELDIRLSVVFYRDRGDSFVTLSLPFTRNVDEAVSFMSATSAEGGGDFPEDMNAGLEAMMRQRWSRDAVPQMLFLLADAPPKRYAGANYTYHDAIRDAAAKGMAIYPVAASGVDMPTEFLFRAMAVMTGGKDVFLTDESGVGEAHGEPDITGYTVEKLNDLMVREIRSYVADRMGGTTVAEAR